MEGYMDFAFFALMNLKYIDWWDHKFYSVTASNVMAIIFLLLLLTIPILLNVFYARNRSRWRKEKFQ